MPPGSSLPQESDATPIRSRRPTVWPTKIGRGIGWPDARLLETVLDRAGLVVLVALGVLFGFLAIDHPPVDPLIFWTAAQNASPYGTTWGSGALYVYPPPLAQILRLVPWSAYVAVWMPLLFAGFWGATRQWSLPVFVVSATFATSAGFAFALSNPAALTFVGNPQILIAAVCVLGFRWPALWAFPILMKLSPGVGLIWFLVRREWRELGIAIGTTLVIIAVSILASPGDWADFIAFAMANAATPSPVPVVPVPFIVRLPMSVALIVWGARTDRRWTVPIAVGWSSLALYEWSAITVWIAALVLATRPPAKAPAPQPLV